MKDSPESMAEKETITETHTTGEPAKKEMGVSSGSILEKDTKSVQYCGDIDNETNDYENLSKNSSDNEE